MTDVKLKCYCYISILETIKLYANKWTLAHLKTVPYKLFIYKSYIFGMYVCVKGFSIK